MILFLFGESLQDHLEDVRAGRLDRAVQPFLPIRVTLPITAPDDTDDTTPPEQAVRDEGAFFIRITLPEPLLPAFDAREGLEETPDELLDLLEWLDHALLEEPLAYGPGGASISVGCEPPSLPAQPKGEIRA